MDINSLNILFRECVREKTPVVPHNIIQVQNLQGVEVKLMLGLTWAWCQLQQ